MGGPLQMLATMLLSQHRVSLFSFTNPWHPLVARYNGLSRTTRAAIRSYAPLSQIGASLHLCIDDWNLPTPVQRRLSRIQASLGKPMPRDVLLGLEQRGVALNDFQSTSCLIYSQSIVQHEYLV